MVLVRLPPLTSQSLLNSFIIVSKSGSLGAKEHSEMQSDRSCFAMMSSWIVLTGTKKTVMTFHMKSQYYKFFIMEILIL